MVRPQAEGHRTRSVHQRDKASSTSGVPTCRASGYAHPTQPHHPSIVVAAPCAGQQGTCIQQPEDIFLQALVHKDVGRHKARPLQLTMVWCGRSNERPYGLVRKACGLMRGRHKARPLQLTMVWCGRSNERPYLDEVGIFNKSLIIIRLYGACGRSNERPYLSVVRIFDDCALVDIEKRAPERQIS